MQQMFLTRWICKWDSATYNTSAHLSLSYSSTPIGKPSELFVDGQVLSSEETQGDPLAIQMYALATIPLVDQLSDIQDVNQMWYADNAFAAGSLASVRKWCDRIKLLGPAYG